MKTDLNSLKKELGRLTDINYLKKEINRVAGEVKKFDVHINLTPQAKGRVEKLERRFRDLLKTLAELQQQVDENLDKVMALVRGGKSGKSTTARASTKKAKTSKKSAGRPARKSAAKTSKKTAKKAAK